MASSSWKQAIRTRIFALGDAQERDNRRHRPRHCNVRSRLQPDMSPAQSIEIARDRGCGNATVYLKRSKQFVILSKNTRRTKSVQTKMLCVPGHGGEIGCIVIP
jgi:hypothetical protein